jgi:hypothetical protein
MTDTTNRTTRSGGPATITIHNCVMGIIGMPYDDSFPVREFKVSGVKPYAQHDRTVDIRFVRPRKRTAQFLTVYGDLRYVTIDAGGQIVYDSRDDLPIDMGEFNATRAEHQRRDREYQDMFKPTSATKRLNTQH